MGVRPAGAVPGSDLGVRTSFGSRFSVFGFQACRAHSTFNQPCSKVALNAPLMRPSSHLQAIYLGVASHPHAPIMRPSCVHHASLKPPRPDLNPKSEGRNPKEIRKPRAERNWWRWAGCVPELFRVRILDFGLPSDLGFRASDFRHSNSHPPCSNTVLQLAPVPPPPRRPRARLDNGGGKPVNGGGKPDATPWSQINTVRQSTTRSAGRSWVRFNGGNCCPERRWLRRTRSSSGMR